MIVYTTNQRRSLRFTGTDWMEEVLAASGVQVSSGNFSVLAGTDAQTVLDSADDVLAGLTNFTASGIVLIEDVANVSGVTGDTLGEFDVITMPSGVNSVVKFAFTCPAQPLSPVSIRVGYSPRTAVSGYLKLKLDYNLFEVTDDLTVASYGSNLTPTAEVIAAADFEKFKMFNFSIPASAFTASGSAPFIVSCQLTRDVSVGSNYPANVSITQIYADNVPGGMIGNQAGYVGGNLAVTGGLTVDGLTVLKGGLIPASGTDTGISGSLVLADDFIYVAPATNTWKRTPIANF